MKTIKWLSLLVLFALTNKATNAQQLRLGDHPYTVEKSAVLDLVSTNQGLLLPRITDTTMINNLNPPNGMIIYYTPANKLLVRTNGNWQVMISKDISRLSNLLDASINLPQNGQILQYDGSSWVNITSPYLSSIDTTDISNFAQKVRGLFTGTSPIMISAEGQISISQAGGSTDGYLSSSDWNTFNNKQPADNYITALTGDITAAGPGSVASTIAPNAVTYSKIQNVTATNKVLGRISSGSGVIEEIQTSGTGDVVRSNAPVLNSPTGLVKGDVALGNVDNTADSLKPISNATQTALNLKINLTQKGANNGVATLDGGGKVPISQLAVGPQVYKGTWSAATNTPHVQDGTGSSGDTYRVVEGGTIDLGSGDITFSASDDIIYNGTIWQRNPATSDVTSVNSQTGTVVLTSDDVGEGYTNKYYTDARANLKINVSEKGANNGVATLDGGGKVPSSQLPVGAQVYKGTWNANTNSPSLSDGTGTAGWTYRVTVAGTQNLGSGPITYSVGDDIIYNGTVWQRNPSSVAVNSVNSQTGAVILTTDDVNQGNNNLYYNDSLARHAFSASTPLSYNSTNGNFSIPPASTSANGYLSAVDWNIFNSKQAAGNYVTALTGDIIASGPGSVGATIANNAVTYSKMQTMTSNRLLGSGASGTTVSEITLGSGLSLTGSTLNAATTGGTVTSVSANDLSPLFTSTVTNPTTTPAISFSLSSQSQNLIFASPISSSGTPTFRTLVKGDLPSTGVYNDQSNTYTSGSKQIFTASNINADIRLTGGASDPSSLSNGDIWYNSTSHLLKYRGNATTRVLVNLDEAQSFSNKTISGASNTLTNIGNSSLSNSTIGLILGTTGSDINVSGSPASLGGSLTLNIPSASSTNRGLLTAADWNTFNNKLASIDTTSISNFYLKVRSLLSGGSGISYNNNTGVITNSGVTSINNNTGALTMDTGYISNFHSKVKSLFSVTAPIIYNSTTGLIGITQATTSANGYLSSTDWNTFNGKQGSGNYMTDPGGNGIIARTALNTTTNRTITGTSNRISLTNGDGVSGNPTIDISSSYLGQTSITTLGTIGTGTWNGTMITSGYGGTGNGFTKFTGPTTSEKIFTLPNTSSTILTDNAAVTVAQGGTGVGSTTAYGVITGGTTSTGALQNAGTGTTGQVLTSNGSSALPTWQSSGTVTGSLLNVQVITSGTTYTPTSGTTKIVLEMIGGGGAGGGASATANDCFSLGGGGGSGGYLKKYLTLAGGASYTIAVGSGGAGSSAAVGGNGGNTTFANGATTYTAGGGTGGGYQLQSAAGTKSIVLGGTGGTAANGDVNSNGQPGGYSQNRGGTSEYYVTGTGAPSHFGGGGTSLASSNPSNGNVSTAGNAAGGNGAGGGGALAQRHDTSQSSAGGNGSAGVIIIYEYK